MGKSTNSLSLVAVPPIRDFYFSPQRLSWLGAQAFVERLSQTEKNLSLCVAPTNTASITQVSLPSYFNYLKPFLHLPLPKEFSFFKGFYQLGGSPKEFAKTVAAKNPKKVYISNFAYSYSDDAIAFAKEIKKLLPDVKLIIGGAGTSVHPDYFKQTSLFDAIQIDDPTDKLPTLLSTIRLNKNEVKLVTILSKGCPRSCNFCSNHLTQGKRFNHIDEQQLIALLKRKKRELDDKNLVCKQFDIEDDNLLLDKAFFFFALEAIHRFFPTATILFENGLDYMLLEEKDIDFLKQYNVNQLNLALASATSKTLINLERTSNIDKLLRLSNYAYKLSISPIIYFICGTKYDSPSHIIDAFNFIKEAKALPGISLFYPVPKLLHFEELSQFKYGESHKTLSAAAYPWSNNLSTKTMVSAFILSRIFYHHQKSTYFKSKKTSSEIANIDPSFFENLGLDMELIYRFFNSKII